MKSFFTTTFIFALLCSPTYALFCPNNFNQINLGDTLDQVILLCGKPDIEKATESEANVPQEWSYYVKPNPTEQASFKMTIAFANDKAINITLNSQSLISTSVCGPAVSVGNSMEQVKAVCGEPGSINKSEQKAANRNVVKTKLITFTYNTNPPITLTFVNGKLVSRK